MTPIRRCVGGGPPITNDNVVSTLEPYPQTDERTLGNARAHEGRVGGVRSLIQVNLDLGENTKDGVVRVGEVIHACEQLDVLTNNVADAEF